MGHTDAGSLLAKAELGGDPEGVVSRFVLARGCLSGRDSPGIGERLAFGAIGPEPREIRRDEDRL